MKKNLYIHVGRDKCGSSSIQQFCENHREALLADGYYYPPTSGLNFHGLASPTFYRGARQSDGSYPHLRAMLEAIDSVRVPNVILSSESFYQDEPEHFDAFRQHDLRFIYYVRRQDDYVESAYNQRIREGSLDPLYDRPVFAGDTLPPIVDYLSAPRRLAERFGDSAIELRLFDRGTFAQHSLVRDFLSAIGHPAPQKFTDDGIVNGSLRGDRLRFAAHLCLVPITRNERFAMMSRLRNVDPGQDDSIPLLSDFERRDIMRSCRADNGELVRRFGHRYDAGTLQEFFAVRGRSGPLDCLPPSLKSALSPHMLRRVRTRFQMSAEAQRRMIVALPREDRALILQKGRYSSQYDPASGVSYCRLPPLPRDALDYRLQTLARDQAVVEMELAPIMSEHRRYGTPHLLEVFEGFNLVSLHHHYYAVPDTLPVDWDDFQAGGSYPEVRSGLTLDELRDRIRNDRFSKVALR